MKADGGRGYRTESDRSNDGFVDHVARRGVEKGAGVAAKGLGIIMLMLLVGVGAAILSGQWGALLGVAIALTWAVKTAK